MNEGSANYLYSLRDNTYPTFIDLLKQRDDFNESVVCNKEDQDDEYHKNHISKNIRNSLVVTIPLHDNIKNKFIITVEKLICTPRIRYNTVTVLITLSPYDDDYYGIVCQEQDLCTEVVFSFDRDKLLDAESRKGLRQYTKTQIQDMVNALVEKFQIIYGDKHVNMRLIREEF